MQRVSVLIVLVVAAVVGAVEFQKEAENPRNCSAADRARYGKPPEKKYFNGRAIKAFNPPPLELNTDVETLRKTSCRKAEVCSPNTSVTS